MADATLRVFRGNKDGGQSVEFKVPVAPGMVVLDALHYIQGHLASDLAVRWNCKAGKCGSCSAEVNGRPRLTCKTRLENLPARRGSRAGVSQVHRMFSMPRRLPRSSRARQEGAIRRPAKNVANVL